MYTVTRQRQWPEGKDVVEVSLGGLDYTNPDALSANYSGEFEEFIDPRTAIDTAIEILRAWRKDSKKTIRLGVGATYGNTMPFEPITIKDARKWAVEAYEKLEKCEGCGEPLSEDKRGRWYANNWDGCEYCSERCATRAAEFEEQETAKLDAEEVTQ